MHVQKYMACERRVHKCIHEAHLLLQINDLSEAYLRIPYTCIYVNVQNTEPPTTS